MQNFITDFTALPIIERSAITTLLIAAVAGLVLAVIFGLIVVPMLRKAKAGQSIREDGPTWHQSKAGTPTMGGIIFIPAIALVSIVLGHENARTGDYSHLLPLALSLVFGAIGFLDDFVKLRKHRNLGLTSKQKLLLQIVAAIAFVFAARLTGDLSPNLYIPFVNATLKLPMPVYLIFAVFVIVAEVNAVNITDGIDGLAAGVTIPVMVAFAAISLLRGTAYGVGIYSAAAVGALVGFLVFNFHPAKVFMGDTGSLFLGGSVAALAFVLDMPLILITLGIIYIVEVVSDVIQILYFKATHGKRFFKMAPFHHHLEQCGWSEYRLFIVFTAVSALFAVISYFAVRGKFLI